MGAHRIRILCGINAIVSSKVQVELDVRTQLFFTQEVWLKVVVDVTKPPKLVLVLNQTCTAVPFPFQPRVVVLPTEAEIKGETRSMLT